MTTQPEALRLADELEMWTLGEPAAAELRRLHQFAEDQIGRATAAEAALQMTRATHALKIAAVEAQRDALLEALTPFVRGNWTPGLAVQAAAAMACLESALAEPVQEPVADRAAFERHAERLGYSVDPDTREGREGGYWSSHTQLMWLTWQAALAEPVQEPDSPERRCGGPGCDMRCCQPAQEPQGCDHCNHPLYAAVKCKVCGRVTEPVQEPVAWRFEARHIDSAWAAAVTLKHPGPEGVYMRNVMPLYAHPPQRKPLTEEEKRALADKFLSCQPESYEVSGVFDLISAVERVHGIGGQP